MTCQRWKRVRSLTSQSPGSIQDPIFGVILDKHHYLQKGHQNWGRHISEITNYTTCSCKYVQWSSFKSKFNYSRSRMMPRSVGIAWERRIKTQPYHMLPHWHTSTTNSISLRNESNTWNRTSAHFSIACWIQRNLEGVLLRSPVRSGSHKMSWNLIGWTAA